ncbi:MAG TPA: WbqC family protein [Thermoanaerobaculia bacterium]
MKMKRTVVIEQPNYVPWIGYFDLIRQSDVWVWYDDVQYTKRDWRNRNRIAADAAEWLTIPVATKGRFTQRICDVEIDDAQPWRRQHLDSIRRCYARAPFFQPMFAMMEAALSASDSRLADLTIRLNESICALLGLRPLFKRSSHIPGAVVGRDQRLISICRAVEGNVYLSGPAARAYIDPRAFAAAQIELRYIIYDYPPYARDRRAFVPNLSILDALAWLGPGETAAYLKRCSRSEREDASA